ncbi:MAG: hypothetical protein COA57_12240 [Flavobacteriales bacterium]|nr:MAG: hypothetical protein COA57_12240 [Flavobacteriales bacterium]
MKTSKITFAVFLFTVIISCSKDQSEVVDPVLVVTPEFDVLIWDETKAFNGPTLLGYDNGSDIKKIIEVQMDGTVSWEYDVQTTQTITDIEYLENGNILFGVKAEGVYEVDKDKNMVWSYTNTTQWHDVDRLANGNTLVTCGTVEILYPYPYAQAPQVKEVDASGNTVWEWYAKDAYLNTPYDTGYVNALYTAAEWRGDWLHLNGAERLANGNTMISIRNFDLVIIVDQNGNVVQEVGSGDPGLPVLATLGLPDDPHNPVLLYDDVTQFSGAWWDDGDMLVSIPWEGRAIVLDTATLNVEWEWPVDGWQGYGEVAFIRDAKPLPNGNILINNASGQLIEVTKSGEVVWKLQIESYPLITQMSDYKASYMIFFKAERYGCGWNLGW